MIKPWNVWTNRNETSRNANFRIIKGNSFNTLKGILPVKNNKFAHPLMTLVSITKPPNLQYLTELFLFSVCCFQWLIKAHHFEKENRKRLNQV